FRPARVVSGSEPLGPTRTSATGETHVFTWDSIADIGVTATAVHRVVIQLTPHDVSGPGQPARSPEFLIGDDPPSVTITAPSAGAAVSGVTTVAFVLADSTSDTA